MHKPVLLTEVLEHLKPKDGEVYVDATFGAGGYTTAILESANCKVYAIDRDENAIEIAKKLKEKFPNNFFFMPGKFSQMLDLLEQEAVDKIDGIVFDLGVSSMQFDNKERGFSFDSDAKLDMRMSGNAHGISAYEVVNEFDEEELAKIIKEFGEEKKAKLIAKKIVQRRQTKPISSCRELADIVRSLFAYNHKIDSATRTFQAIRIFVNQELEEISLALNASKKILTKNARLIVVSFHSLEDSIVKNFLKKEAGIDETFSRYEPTVIGEKEVSFKIVNKSAIKPSEAEIAQNYRSRSSKMRVALKV